jgi:hypothetical protein
VANVIKLFSVVAVIRVTRLGEILPFATENTIKQFYIVNLTKTWLGNFSLSLGDFFTKHLVTLAVIQRHSFLASIHTFSAAPLSSMTIRTGACIIKLITAVIYGFT